MKNEINKEIKQDEKKKPAQSRNKTALDMMAEGFSIKQIADITGLSVAKVRKLKP